MVELTMRGKRKREIEELISQALAPVWEANHVWIILAVVIVFCGFPAAFSEIATVFHIPLTVMLVGIILRGCSFTFRHYDPFYDAEHDWFSRAFILSSVLTPFTQGLVIGGCLLGRIPPIEAGFYEYFVAPWWNVFSIAVGLFLCSLCFWIASVFLAGETADRDLQAELRGQTYVSSIVMVICGGIVFLTAELSGLSLLRQFIGTHAMFAVVPATLTLVATLAALRNNWPMAARFLAAGSCGAVVVGWFASVFPFIIGGHPTAQRSLSLYDAAAGASTQRQLAIALVVGALLIFPSLVFLLKTFKSSPEGGHPDDSPYGH